MRSTILAYVLVGIFLGTEGRLRQGQTAQTLNASEVDRGSTRSIGMALGITITSLLLAPLLNHLRVGRFPARSSVSWLGIPLMVCGILLRVWANRTLGEFYTRTLVVSEQQHVVESGPYRILRHPGYLGSILMWIGAALATANGVALAVTAIVMPAAYTYRIQSEEAMLLAALGDEYVRYKTRTWRLIPGLY
jgi:protein-S-isoprenylcysteine O-methyltransferase Ste14